VKRGRRCKLVEGYGRLVRGCGGMVLWRGGHVVNESTFQCGRPEIHQGREKEKEIIRKKYSKIFFYYNTYIVISMSNHY
jgi:hypothetical protein